MSVEYRETHASGEIVEVLYSTKGLLLYALERKRVENRITTLWFQPPPGVTLRDTSLILRGRPIYA